MSRSGVLIIPHIRLPMKLQRIFDRTMWQRWHHRHMICAGSSRPCFRSSKLRDRDCATWARASGVGNCPIGLSKMCCAARAFRVPYNNRLPHQCCDRKRRCRESEGVAVLDPHAQNTGREETIKRPKHKAICTSDSICGLSEEMVVHKGMDERCGKMCLLTSSHVDLDVLDTARPLPTDCDLHYRNHFPNTWKPQICSHSSEFSPARRPPWVPDSGRV